MGTPGIPGMPAGTVPWAPEPALAAVVQPPPGNAAPEWFVTWVAVVQACGTDNCPTRLARAVTADTPPKPGMLAGPCAGNVTLASPGTPIPPGAVTVGNPLLAPAASELISEIPLVAAGVMIAGLIYPAELSPLKRLEFKKVPRGLPSLPERKFRSCVNPDPIGEAASVELPDADEMGDASPCRAVGSEDISCASMSCVPAAADALVVWATAAA